MQASKRSGATGSAHAIESNERAIGRHLEVVERRLVGARSRLMAAKAHNERLRAEVDACRREVMATALVRQALRQQRDSLAQDTAAIQVRVASQQRRAEQTTAMADGEAAVRIDPVRSMHPACRDPHQCASAIVVVMRLQAYRRRREPMWRHWRPPSGTPAERSGARRYE